MAAKKDEGKPQGLTLLKQQLKTRNPGRLYIFYGEEVYLLKYYLGRLRDQIVDPVTESFNSHRFNQENFSLQDFGDAVESMPMMAERTFVQVDDVDLFRMPEGDRAKIAEFLSDIPQWCTLVFTYETVEWKPDKRIKKLWGPIDENAQIVEFAKQDQRDLVAWIQRHFLNRGKRIAPDLCAYLIDITGGTMTALSGEIEKICGFSGAENIHRSDIDAVVEPVMDAVVFQMTDLLSAGRYAPALEKLQTLLKMQQEPLAILGAVGSHYRRAATARTLLDHGKNASDLAKLYGIQEYPARKSMDAARRLRPEFLARASELILETDYAMKTSYDDPERLLEMLILRLAQEGRNG